MRAPALEIEQLTVSYDRAPVLIDVNLRVGSGRLVGVVGPNGAGKSTLLKACLELIARDAGRVRVLGDRLKAVRRQVVYVPQRRDVDWDFPVTVLDVVVMGRYGARPWWSRPGAEDRAAARAALAQVGLEDLAPRPISDLSGGQQQRAFLARALAQQGDLYFMDEPFVGVDAATERAIVDTLQRLRDEGRTVIVVNHDLTTARRYFDDLLLLNKEVVAFGPVDETFTAPLLQRTYGGRLTMLSSDGGVGVLDA